MMIQTRNFNHFLKNKKGCTSYCRCLLIRHSSTAAKRPRSLMLTTVLDSWFCVPRFEIPTFTPANIQHTLSLWSKVLSLSWLTIKLFLSEGISVKLESVPFGARGTKVSDASKCLKVLTCIYCCSSSFQFRRFNPWWFLDCSRTI